MQSLAKSATLAYQDQELLPYWFVVTRAGSLQSRVRCIKNLCEGRSDQHLTIHELTKIGSPDALKHELSLSGKSADSYPESFLGNFEKENKKKYEERMGNANLDFQSYCLNQNPAHFFKVQSNGVLPCFTKTDKITWIPSRKRHLLAIEKFAGHGFPVTADLASALKTSASLRICMVFACFPSPRNSHVTAPIVCLFNASPKGIMLHTLGK